MDGGLNVRDEQSQIGDSQSPYDTSNSRPGIINMISDGRGGIQKRKGQQRLCATSLGVGAINGLWVYKKANGTTTRLIHHTTKLYTQSGTNQPVQILTGLADTKSVAFVFDDIFYLIDGAGYFQYDGTTAATVTPYVPKITVGRSPDGTTSSADEELNVITNSWRDVFTGTIGATQYYLSYTGLSATVVKAWVSGIIKTENVDFTVNRTTGIVTFSVAPGATDVIIQAEKDNLNDATLINKCKYFSLFGGMNDTRVFLTGNPGYPNRVFWTAVDDATYWPLSNYNDIGSLSDFNTGLVFQYDQLLVLKQRSIYRIEYEIISGVGDFPSYPLNNAAGCDMPGSIQIIDNMPVFCSTSAGPQIITASNVRTEKNVSNIGDLIRGTPIRPGLLSESVSDLQNATSFDDGRHYILCVGSKAWIWDYLLSPWSGSQDAMVWYYWENINANCWLLEDNQFYFGDRTNGLVWQLIDNKNDDGVAINGIWTSKLFHFGYREWLKTIYKVFFSTNITNYGNITIDLINDRGDKLYTKTVTSSSFNWDLFDWDTFTWDVNKFDPVFPLKPKIKKVKYFQVQLSNNEMNEDLSALDFKIYYELNRLVKT